LSASSARPAKTRRYAGFSFPADSCTFTDLGTAGVAGRLLAEAPVRAVPSLNPGDAVTPWYDPAEATSLPG
jgi:hypothetical protein